MKKILTIIFLLSTFNLFAQPVNDDCAGIIDLGVVPFCPANEFFTNENATATDIGNDNIPLPGACGDNDITFVGNDVWFQFTTSDTITDYTITVTGMTDGMGSTPLSNPQIMIYRGALCGVDEMALLACGAADDGESILELDVLDLDPNEVYYIRINDFSSNATPNWGSFLLCIDEIDPINTIDESGSTACTGELYDTGGPDADYSSNEDNTFSICPPIGQNVCVTFTLEYYNIELGNDQLVFYDGPDTNPANQIAEITGDDFQNTGNAGGVCFTVQASSGCLTVEFTSDGNSEFEGFAGAWECSATPCEPLTSISVNDDITDQDIIDNISTPQTLVTVDTIICAEGAYGTFAAPDDTDLGLEKGLILTSGSVLNALGPNTQGGVTGANGGPAATDADLNYLSQQSGGFLSEDACVVEVDVFVATDELVFEYIFGSEEYPDFVNQQFNDIFALLISGPGITGDPNINDQENIAVIPGTTTPVEINSVNDINNWEYYRNNFEGPSVEYDGLTSDFLGIKKSLTARRAVTPCNTYHLKFAIADRGDNQLDSGVFISEIKGGTPELSINFASGVDYLVEDCTGANDELLISLSNPLEDSASYDVIIGGTAVEGVDYILDIPDEVTIAPGETLLSFPILPLSDGLVEGVETIIITLTNNFGCGDIELTQIIVELSDAPIVDIFTGLDTAFVCAGGCLTMEVDGAVDYVWEPADILDDSTSVNPVACPTTSQSLTVTGTISALPGCSDTDTIWLEVIDPQMDVVALGDVDLCEGSSVQLQAVNNVNNTNLEWTPADGLDATDQEVVTSSPDAGTYTYEATVTLSGCSASDTITVTVDAFDFPTLTTTDTLICQGESVTLAESIPFTTTVYEWTPDIALAPSNTVSNPIATPESTTTYTLNATSASGFCSDMASITVEVLPAEINIMPEDTVFICKGEIATLTATTTNGMIEWFPVEGLDDPTSLTVNVDIEESQWYFASMTVGACSVLDSVFVRVDSIPDLPITALPDNAPYCPGELITFISPTFEPLDYPDISHMWAPGLGAESDLDNLNLVISAVESTTYIRTTTNNACSQTDEIFIEVVDAGDIEVAWTDTTICEGVQVVNEVFNGTDPEWSPGGGLSCTDCAMTTITAQNTTTYEVEISLNGCPITADVQVNVLPDAIGDLIDNTGLCFGNDTTLNLVVDPTPGTTYSWTATPVDPTLNPSDAQPNVTPLVNTTYSVTVSNGVCDDYIEEVTIIIIDDPVFTFDNTPMILCPDDELVLSVSPDLPNYIWTDPNGNQVGQGSNVSISDPISGDYTVTYPLDDCGNAFTSSVNITVTPDVNLSISTVPDTSIYLQGTVVELTVVADPDVSGVYTWSGNQSGEIVFDTLLTVPEETIVVTLTTPENCVFTDSITLDVEEAEFGIPNAFTPNNDGVSDFFNVFNPGNLEILDFQIFNRWGKMVYDNETPTTGWDGKFKDEDQPSDVYYYRVRYQNPAGEITEEGRDLTLIR